MLPEHPPVQREPSSSPQQEVIGPRVDPAKADSSQNKGKQWLSEIYGSNFNYNFKLKITLAAAIKTFSGCLWEICASSSQSII